MASVVALTWPLADLAAHWSLTALVTQRLILLMAVAPLLLLGLPYDVVQWLTRPGAGGRGAHLACSGPRWPSPPSPCW